MKRIVALVPNVLGWSPGQRVRIESWAIHLQRAGWTVNFYPFEDARLHEVFYQPGRPLAKAVRLLSCYLRQLKLLLRRPPCDVVFIYREAALIGPALLERLAARIAPVVYDVDDPIFLPYHSPTSGWFSLLKFSRKTHSVFRLSDHVIVINNLIGDYAANFNPAISVIPNCVDIERYCPEPRPSDSVVRLVWIGSHSTMSNLQEIVTPLRRLQTTIKSPQQVSLRIIGAGEVELPGVQAEIRQWSASTEVADLQECDIGLVPLLDLPWNHWKFNYKTVQYMAVGLPVVARRMGSNNEIIQDGVNGFLVDNQDEWYDRIHTLVTNHDLRLRMGKAARATIVERFSMQAQAPLVVSIFERMLQQSRA